MTLASLPSPTHNVWMLGPIPVRAYALAIIVGVVVGIALTERRYVARGGAPGTATDVAVWAVPFGLVGARLYHLATDPELYFSPGRDPWNAFRIWDGGLGIWGGVALGALGAWIALRRRHASLASFADAAAPGVVLAQAIGRVGNYFNNELYGRRTNLPWGLTIHVIDPNTHRAVATLPGHYQPTFLYELIWDVAVAVLVIWAGRRFRLVGGRSFALYVMGYTVGRAWIEYLRVDHANHFLGLRLNDWTSIVVFAAALAFFLLRRDASGAVYTDGRPERPDSAAERAEASGSTAEPDPAPPDIDRRLRDHSRQETGP